MNKHLSNFWVSLLLGHPDFLLLIAQSVIVNDCFLQHPVIVSQFVLLELALDVLIFCHLFWKVGVEVKD